MAELRFASNVFRELEEAIQWYERRSPEAAIRFCDETDAAFDSIAAYPHQFAQWKGRYRYLLLKHFPYHLIYRINDNVVTIASIRHTSRDDYPLIEE
jgi:plasmid stabilization system protein ParE